MTTRIILVRHASHDRLGRMLCGRMSDVHLGEMGRREAARLAERFARDGAAGRPVAAVYASPLERAQETAEPIAAACGAPLLTDEDLGEIDFGVWSGLSFDDLSADPRWSRWNADRARTRAPGGETMAEAQGRTARWLGRVAERHPDETVVGVSHGDVIKAGLAHVLGLPLHFHDRFDIDPSSVSVVVAGAWGMKVERLNEAAS